MAASKEKIIRNLMWVPQNLRFGRTKGNEDNAVELTRRGERGDTAAVTEVQQKTTAYKMGVDKFFEVITQSEADKIAYADENPHHHDYQLDKAVVIRDEDVTINQHNIYTDPRTGKVYQRQGGVGPRVAQRPGSDLWQGQALSGSVEAPLPTQGRFNTPIERRKS